MVVLILGYALENTGISIFKETILNWNLHLINSPLLIKIKILQNTVLIMDWPIAIAYFGMMYSNFKQGDEKVSN